jgi:hypothetical protein
VTQPSRPVVIVGLPRSGTTWTLTALSQDPGIRTAPERDNEDNNPSAIYAKRHLGRYPLLEPGDAAADYRRLWAWILSGATEHRRQKWARLILGPAAKERIFDGKRDAAAWLAGVVASNPRPGRATPGDPAPTTIVAKSIHAQLAVEWLASEFDITVLVLLRHPGNVLASWQQVKLKDGRNSTLETSAAIRERFGDPWGVPQPGPDPVERMCWRIGLLTAVLEDAASRHPDWHVVTHEDLCVDPVAKFKVLCEQLGLPWTDQREEYLVDHNTPGEGFRLKRVAEDLPNSWEHRLDDDALGTLQRVLAWFPIRNWTASDFQRTTDRT